MSRVLLAETAKRQKGRFWSRQFTLERTAAQDAFDVIFGILLPVLTLLADPIVFKGGIFGGEPVLGDYQLFAYLFIGLEIVFLLVWLILSRHLTTFSAPVGGVLVAGGIFSLGVGIVILPYSLLGLILLIGATGFTPFLTAFVYFRNGARALKAQVRNDMFSPRFLVAFDAALLVLGAAALVSYQLTSTISKATDDLLDGDPVVSEQAYYRLKWLPLPEIHRRQFVETYHKETNEERRGLIRKYYTELTGEDIDSKERFIYD